MMKMLQMTNRECALLRTLVKIRVGYYMDLTNSAKDADQAATHKALADEYQQMYHRMEEL